MGYCKLGNAVNCIAMFDAQLSLLLFIDALDVNTLTGPLPSEIGLMSTLVTLYLSE